MSHPCRRRVAAGILGLLACVVSASLPAGAYASGGTFTHVVCADPSTNEGTLVNDGRLPDGLDTVYDHPYLSATDALTRCSGTMHGGRGIVLSTGAHYEVSAPNYGVALRYRVPDGLVFGGGELWRQGEMSGRWSWAIHRGADPRDLYAGPADERCSWAAGCLTRGTKGDLWTSLNRVTIGASALRGFNLALVCEPGGQACRADATQRVHVYGARLTIGDEQHPSVAAGVSGSLVADPVLAGAETVSLRADDAGSGVYRVRVLVDGAPRLSQAVDVNDGRCTDINPSNDDDYEFAWQRPCRMTADGTWSLDTTALPEGSHDLRVVVEDAAGNAATVVPSRQVTIDNVAAPSPTAAPWVSGSSRQGSSLAVVAGAWDDHGVEGEPVVAHRWQRCARDGSACSDVPGGSGSTYTLSQADVGARVRVVETATNSEGTGQSVSALSGVVTRADGTLPPDRDGIDNDGDGQVDEPGEPDGGSTEQPTGAGAVRLPGPGAGGSGAGVAGGASSSSAMGAPGGVNGEGASPHARLTVAFRGRTGAALTARFGRSVAVEGRVVDEHGRPIRGAIVDVTETLAVRGAAARGTGPVVTGSDGVFRYTATARSGGRTLRFAYRFLRDGDAVTQADLSLRVRAAVSLTARLRGAVVSYRGRVASGPMPRGGKLVVVQGRVRGGRWQTFATRRARRAGRFSGRYRLKVRRPGVRLQFRARVLGESGWPYVTGTSRAVTRRVK